MNNLGLNFYLVLDTLILEQQKEHFFTILLILFPQNKIIYNYTYIKDHSPKIEP